MARSTIRKTVAAKGMRHITLCPGTQNALRIHLIPPRPTLREVPFVVLLNGYYILPLKADDALLLAAWMDTLAPHDGEMLDNDAMRPILREAMETAAGWLGAPSPALVGRLGDILDCLFATANGELPALPRLPNITLRQYARYMPAPHRMDLMISSMHKGGKWNCNLKCRHCYAAGQPNASLPELATEQWQSIIDRCAKAGIPQLTFTGGEPTLREDLPQLVAHAKGLYTRLNTNGALMDKALCKKLAVAGLGSAQFTVYSADEEIHNTLVGAEGTPASGNLAKTLTGLQNALAAGIDVSVNTPLCLQNQDYTATLTKLRGLGVRYVSCSGMIPTGLAAGAASKREQLTAKEITEILQDAAAFCAANGMALSFTSPGWVEGDVLHRLQLTQPVCGAAHSNMAVAPNGDVVPCQSWLGNGAALGNMLVDDWGAIWRSPLCKKLRGMAPVEAEACPLRGGRFVKEEKTA